MADLMMLNSTEIATGLATDNGMVNISVLAELISAVGTVAASDSFASYQEGRYMIDSGDTAWMLTSCAFVLLSASRPSLSCRPSLYLCRPSFFPNQLSVPDATRFRRHPQ